MVEKSNNGVGNRSEATRHLSLGLKVIVVNIEDYRAANDREMVPAAARTFSLIVHLDTSHSCLANFLD